MKFLFSAAVVFIYACLALGAEDRDQMAKDSFCPMVEGKTLSNCCPAKFGAAQECEYTQLKVGGQECMVDSSVVTDCIDTGTGDLKPVYTKCCSRSYSTCEDGDTKVILNYLPRLIRRNNSCIMSSCPVKANYWVNPMPSPDSPNYAGALKFKPDPTKWNINSIGYCTGTVIEQCQYNVPCSDISVKTCGTCHSICAKLPTPEEQKACRQKRDCLLCEDTNSCPVPKVPGPGNPPPPPPPGDNNQPPDASGGPGGS